MKKDILEYLQISSNDLSTEAIILGFVAATIIALVIFLSYRFSHSSAVYSAKFNVSLVMLTLVTTLIMSVIGNNVALSLGMVGALSIVRYRTAIKDPRDTAYIFWSIAAGICYGVQDFMVAGIGSCVIFLVMLVMGNVQNNDRYLLVVRGEKKCAEEVSDVIEKYFSGKAKFRVENSTTQSVEEIYEVSQKVLDAAQKGNDTKISDLLYKISGVESVNTVCQNDEVNR